MVLPLDGGAYTFGGVSWAGSGLSLARMALSVRMRRERVTVGLDDIVKLLG
jgi:hypothetical protein